MTKSPPSTTNLTAPVRSRFTRARAVPMIGVESGAMIMAPMTVAVESAMIPALAMQAASSSMVQYADRFESRSPSLRSRSEVSSSNVRRWFCGSTRARMAVSMAPVCRRAAAAGRGSPDRQGTGTGPARARPTIGRMPELLVRDATAADAAACVAIYEPYVTSTTVTFETDPPDAAEMRRRIAKAQARHAFLVLEEDSAVVGYAYAGPFKERAAYRWSCEVSVYLSPDRHGRGGGRR